MTLSTPRHWGVDLPAGWCVGQIRHTGTVTLGKMLQSAGDGGARAPYLRAANVQPDGVLALQDVKEMLFEPGELAQLTLRRGDVVVVEGGQGGYGRAAYVHSNLVGWGFQNSIMRLRPNGADGRFIAYYLLAARERGFIQATCNVVSMPHYTSEKLSATPIPLPPTKDQVLVADYLDRETAQIDALIGKQERLIETLRERRNGVLLRGVTKGVDRSVDVRQSGLRWAGGIPRHWDVGNIRRYATMKTGHTPSRSTSAYWRDCHIPWVTLADVHQMRPGTDLYVSPTTSACISELGLTNSAAELLPAKTVMLSRTASVGFAAMMPTAMATSQDYWNWVCGPGLSPEYLTLVFRAMREEFRALMTGSTHKTIYQATAASLSIPVPPLEEQKFIVVHLLEAMHEIDALLAKAEQLIVLVRERRSALITAAVTGQIDVRRAA